jgi:hypothetical protein
MRRLCCSFLFLAVLCTAITQAEEQDDSAPGIDGPVSDSPVPGGPDANAAVPGEPAADETLSEGEGPATEEPELDDSPLLGIFPRFKRGALILDISARIVEQNQTVIWNESHRKATISGRPVGIKLVGANVVVAVQFTPYLRRGLKKFLVAQGQIWMDIPNQGMRCHTSMQTIPLEFGEPIYFFPLGPLQEDDAARIEVMLTLHPYEENTENN